MNRKSMVSLFHILFVFPLLYYVSTENLPNWGYYALIVMGVGIAGYHGQKVIQRGLQGGFIHALHTLLFAPLLILVGVYGRQVFWGVRFALKALAFSALGIHGMRLLQ